MSEEPDYSFVGARKLFYKRLIKSDGYSPSHEKLEQATRAEATLVSSEVREGFHQPVIDLDFPCTLSPSLTSGHFHLYMHETLPWSRYKRLLRGLYRAGLIQRGWYKQAIAHKRSYVRLPWAQTKIIIDALLGQADPSGNRFLGIRGIRGIRGIGSRP